MRWKTSKVSRTDVGSFRLQVDVLADDSEKVITRTYVFAAPGMRQADVQEACAQAAAEASRQDTERRTAETAWVGLSGEVAT